MREEKTYEDMNLKEKWMLFKRTAATLHRYNKWNFPVITLQSMFEAAYPLVNIWLSSLILDELVGAREIKRLVFLVLLTVGLNFALYFGKQALLNVFVHLCEKIACKEGCDGSEFVLQTDFENLENPAFQKKAQEYDQIYRNNNGALRQIIWVGRTFFLGLFSTLFSILMVVPFFRVVFKRTGPSFWESPWLTVALLGVMAVCAAAMLISGQQYQKLSNRNQRLFNRTLRSLFYYDDLMEKYQIGKEIRLFHEQELIEYEMHDKVLGTLFKGYWDSGTAQSRYGSTNALILAVMTGAIYLFVALKALAGLLSPGNLLKYIGAIQQVASGVDQLISGISMLAWLQNANYFFRFIDAPSVKYQGTLPVEKRDDNDYTIAFQNVSFRYPGAEDWALKDFSIRLRVGERLAVVGLNGSGKTTFIKLLCRLYDPQEGVITLNGIDIKKYDYEEYMTLFSVVFQDFCVFSFPLGQNVTTSLEYDAQKVWRCLEQAGFAERAGKMPKGLDTALYKDFEEDGVEISGGEAQKIALARALYKDAPFIVLDEPTAALDPVSEHEIYERFNQFVGEKTAIYISHRLSSCRFCDQIAVFDQGRLIQKGSHDELLADEQGKYHALWHAQAQYYVPAEEHAANRI